MGTSFTLRQLAYFVAAAEHGSMTAAGRAVHVSQSAISLAVGDLERELGAQLFIRHHAHGLSLTPAGHRIIAGARELLAGAVALADDARELGDALRGDLTLACYDTIAPFLMPGLVASFAGREPGVRLDVREGDMAELHDLVRSGGSELMICYDLDLGRDLAVTPLLSTRPYVLLPAHHPLSEREQISLGEVAGDPFVLLDQPQPAAYFLGLFAAAGLDARIAHRTSSFEMVRSLVARSLGYSLLIQRPAIDVSYEGLPLVCRPVADPAQTLTIVAATTRGTRATRRATAFVEHCVEHLAGTPPTPAAEHVTV